MRECKPTIGRLCRSKWAARLQELRVSTASQSARVVEQTAQLAAVGMVGPHSARDGGAENGGADLVLAGTGLFEVERPEHVHPARYFLLRKRWQWPGSKRKAGMRGQSKEALGRGDAQSPEPVGLNHDRQRGPVRRRIRTRQQDTVFDFPGKPQDQMEALSSGERCNGVRPVRTIEAEMRVGVGRSRNEADEVREQFGAPEQDSFIATTVRVLQDFATPSDGRRRREKARRPVRQVTWPRPHGNRDCDAGTPMPSRSDRVPSGIDTRPEAARHRASSSDNRRKEG